MSMSPGFNYLPFDSKHGVWLGRLSDELCNSEADFELLWCLHPEKYPSIFLHGRKVALPRWQQAYGADYYFSGKSSKALPVPEILLHYLSWGQKEIDDRLNGLLLNWYDGRLGHYIGAHRDSIKGLVEHSVIVMISLGGTRVMRFRSVKPGEFIDIEAADGDVIIMPWSTNHNYKHEVPKLKRFQNRRISITMRCFERQF